MNNKDNYLIHRIYSVFDEPKLRVCENISKVSDIFTPNYSSFNATLKNERLTVQGIKLAVPTDLEMLTFENEIILNPNT